MPCPRCQFDNLADALYCAQCGSRLQLLCGTCNAVNAAGSRYCRLCGAGLQAPAAAPRAAQAVLPPLAGQDGAPPGERKIITALFADIKGSMSLLDEMDPEQARQVIDPALRLMIDAVDHYDGFVAQTLGDGIFALFGAPLAREDHARRAVYAALSMQEQIKSHGARLLKDHGLPPLQIRVGINTGEVVVRTIATDAHRTDYVPVGNTTGLAARLEALAAPGTVLLSEATQRLVDGYFEFRKLEAVPVKGLSQPVDLFEVAGVGALRTRLEVSARHGLARFVGRSEEFDRLCALLEFAKAGQGQAAALVGEAGVGKSRLCLEFKRHAQRDCLVLEHSVQAYGQASALQPLIDMLKGYFRIAPGETDQRIAEQVAGRMLALDRRLAELIPLILGLFGIVEPQAQLSMMDPQIRRQRGFEALSRLLQRIALDRPLLMVLEDLHWVDEETQSFLGLFAESLSHARIMLLVNYRPQYRQAWAGRSEACVLALHDLARDDAQALLGAMLGSDPGLGDLKRQIIDKTQGNPFFMEEYVQTLFEQGVLLRGERVRLGHPALAMQMPATVQGVLAARIDALQPADKALLQLLAVLGPASPLRLIERLADAPREVLQARLDRLLKADFMVVRADFPDVDYVFKHALTRETAYAGLLAETRRALHRRAAAAIQSHYGDRLDEHYADLAHHHACSDDVPAAISFLQRAAAKAGERSRYADAMLHLRTALGLLPRLSDAAQRQREELSIQAALGAASSAACGFAADEVGAAYERARALCGSATDSADLMRVLPGVGLYFLNRGDLRRAHETGAELLRLATQRQDDTLSVCGHELLGLSLLRSGDLLDCRKHMDKALALYREEQAPLLRASLGRDPAVSCLGFGALALWLLGHADQAVAAAAQSQQRALQAQHPFSTAYAALSVAWVHQMRREAQATLREAQAAVAFSIEHGFPSWQAHALLLQGWATVEQGAADAGIALIDRALATYGTTGAKVWQPLFLLIHAQAAAKAGYAPSAMASVDTALGIAHDMGSYWWAAELFRSKGELLAARGAAHAADARRCFDRALLIAQTQAAKSLELRARSSLLRLAGERGDVDSAAAELRATLASFTEGLDTADLRDAQRLLMDCG